MDENEKFNVDFGEVITVSEGSGSLDNYGTLVYLDDNNVEQSLVIATFDDFIELCSQGGYLSLMHVNNVSFRKNQLKEITIADGVRFIPDYFCYTCQNLTTVNLPSSIVYIGSNFCDTTGLSNKLILDSVVYVGTNFLSNSSRAYIEDIELPKVEYIGSNFLYNNYNFNGNVILNDDCRIIKGSFMVNCWNFTKPFAIPSGLESLGDGGDVNPGQYFMNNCRAFTGPLVCNSYVFGSGANSDNNTLSTTNNTVAMYTTGVTLTGPYASNWKSFFPNRASSPYRKLIIG